MKQSRDENSTRLEIVKADDRPANSSHSLLPIDIHAHGSTNGTNGILPRAFVVHWPKQRPIALSFVQSNNFNNDGFMS